MRRSTCIAWALVLSATSLSAQTPLQTTAEKTEYKATSRYADVVAFCEQLAKQYPATVRYSTFGTTVEGRVLPLLTLSEGAIASPADAAKANKLVVMAVANIHAGEVDGKEALLALARDLASDKEHKLLKDLVILLVPILNADGNERIDPAHRPEQNGPAGVGIRANAQGLDLNRDFIKLETPEVRGLVRLINTWSPAVVVDCHTTNGSRHRYTLTYDGPRYPSTRSGLSEWVASQMLPEVGRRVKAETGFDTGPYGHFSDDRTRWDTYRALPRYGTQYLSLRGIIGILSESYIYAPFADRVNASRAFVRACFAYAAEKKDTIRKLVDSSPPWPRVIALRTKVEAFPGLRTILGYEEAPGRTAPAGKPKDYRLAFWGAVTPTHLVSRPLGGYLLPASYRTAVDVLLRHGIAVEELREDVELDCETYRVTAIEKSAREFQTHKLMTVEAKARAVTRKVPAGTFLVRTAKPLGTLAAYLLEPESEDGLTAWNVFDASLAVGQAFPVVRLPRPVPLTTGPIRPLAEGRTRNKPINEALLSSHRGFAGNAVSGIEWLPDGVHFLQPKSYLRPTDSRLWKVEARSGRAELFADPDKLAASLIALGGFTAEELETLSKRTTFRMDPARTGTLVNRGTDLVFAYFDGRPAVRLTQSKETKEAVSFAPVGQRVAFVEKGNLYTVAVGEKTAAALTHDGGGPVLNGKADWVYEEEIFNRHDRAFWWSPDGQKLAFLRFDDTPVKPFTLVDLQPTDEQVERYPYPKPGEPNPLVTIGVVPASGGKPTFLDMGEYRPGETLVTRVGWLPDSKGVFAYLQNRMQTWLDFVVWPDPAAKPRRLFRETTKAWVEDLGPPHFLPDGSFLALSERTGWKHLYHYAGDGSLIRQVTRGEWAVREVSRVDADDKRVYFTRDEIGDRGIELCRIDLDGDGLVSCASGRGLGRDVSLAPKGFLFVDRVTDDDTPTHVRLEQIPPAKGEMALVRTLDANPVYEREEYRFGKYERTPVLLKDGTVLAAAITYPPDFDRKKKYPVWMLTYAGPHAPSVQTGWRGGRVFEQILAASGIVVFRVDPRSASGKSAASAWACYKQLGVRELKDLEEAVAWLGKNDWMDRTRVGISGHSYGGFMAAYALTHSKAFSAGIASGPVTDWHLYDTIYTERYMLTPKENPVGYEKTSVVKAAKDLHGRLLILHGMMDDNVHMQNSTQLANALQKAGKEFEMMFYPQARHALGGPHYYKVELQFIRRAMGVGP